MEGKPSDKLIREKLSGLQFPFEPKNWEQMETMLNEKNDRKGFFWWWTTGIAALLLIGVGGYFWMTTSPTTSPVTLNTTTTQESPANNNTATPGTIENSNPTAANTNEKTLTNTTGQNPNNTTASSPVVTNKVEAEANPSVKNKNSTQHKVTNKQKHNTTNTIAKREKKAAKKQAANKTTQKSEKVLLANEKDKTTQTTDGYVMETTLLETIIPVETKLPHNLLSEDETIELLSTSTEEGTVTVKKKRSPVHYSLGIMANVTASITGPSRVGINNSSGLQSSSLSTRPSYMIGFTHELNFLKVLSVTNAVLFSQTSYKVPNPRNSGSPSAPLQYTSKISEMNIMLGLKAYIFSKKQAHIYIAAGIINHIKLKETFAYKTDTTNISSSPSGSIVFPTENSFSDALNSNNGSGNKSSTSDFAINHAKRYYTSFYGSAGVDLILRGHYVLFGEGMFYMGLQKIGIQEMHKYNVGFSGGFRYRF